MYSRTRKTQETPNNGSIEETTTYSQQYSHNNQHHHHHHHHHHSQHHHTSTIPANKDGKRYTMNEVFQVWYDNKDQILNTEVPVSSDEPYKLAKPEPIYHLDLQSSPNKADELPKETTKEVTESLDKLTIGGGDSEIENITQGSGIASIQTAATEPGTGTGTIPSSIGQAPPGMVQLPKDLPSVDAKFRPLVTSDKIEWFYIDPSGNEQGPFNGDMMQEWLTGGYLNLDLKIRRKEESGFKTLRDLCESLLNYGTPFKIPLPDLTTVSNSGSQFFPTDLQGNNFPPFQSNLLSSLGGNVPQSNLSQGNLSQSNLFGNDFMKSDPFSTTSLALVNQAATPGGFGNTSSFGIDTFNQQPSAGLDAFNHNLSFPSMPSILQQQIHQQQQPSLSRANSGWGVDTTTSSILQSGSNPQTPIGGHPSLPSQISQPVPNSPWLPSAVGQSHSRVNSPFASATNLNLVGQEPLTVQHDVDVSKVAPAVPVVPAAEPAPQLEDPVLEEIHSSVVTDFLNDEEPKPVDPPTESEVAAPGQQQQQQPVIEEQPSQSEEKEVEGAKPVDLKPSAAPTLAPWAAPKQPSKKPALTLKEIQRLEAEKLAEQKKIEAQIKSEQAAKAWANAAAAEKQAKAEKAASVALPSSWGNASAAPVTKTLAEIQKEEAERAKAKLAAANSANAAAKLSATNTSFASALANSVPKDDGPAWTTVASKKQPPAPVTRKSSANVATTSAAKTTPQLLRSVSANKQNTSTINAQSVREDFLVWARSNMTSLYPTVSKEDLLDIFITLPPNSADSASLIAETIYSSSATMDGRRFAQEFLKRRQKVDQQIGGGDHVSWSAAIISSADKVPTVDEDGWSTSLKSKKKNGKRN
ncbi:Protein SMY2 [Candida viswanathii]|uniref:Protein SMY2 n=1 Tax=Candida viswanathii TaxID=5486 RepID=A0A367XTW3_9ASCO|nr:Protein SMY2 [Candida viswanathii]